MKPKFKGKYRIESTRLQQWDYGWNAIYFITACTKNRVHSFGNVENGLMKLSDIGEIVQKEWIKSIELRPDMNLRIGEFVVMPNHFHGIIEIGKNEYNKFPDKLEKQDEAGIKNRFGPQSKNLASIMRGFKSSVTIQSRKIDPNFQWQPNYHDSIISDLNGFKAVTRYIKNNPSNWKEDDFY